MIPRRRFEAGLWSWNDSLFPQVAEKVPRGRGVISVQPVLSSPLSKKSFNASFIKTAGREFFANQPLVQMAQ
jgi:hypothetical protein